MERPTCETCVFYSKEEIEPGHTRTGHCHRFPPAYVPHPQHPSDKWHPKFPLMVDDRWCGEHPDFPAYIASLKSKSGPDDWRPLGLRANFVIRRAMNEGMSPDSMSLDEWLRIKGCGITTARKLFAHFKTPSPHTGRASPSPARGY